MITINIYYKGKGSDAKDFVFEMISSGIVQAIRKEPGNLRYDYFYPINDDNTVLLIDSWENQQALDLHHKSKLMEQIAILRNKYDLHMIVEKYESIDMMNDKKYIKE